MFGLGRGLHSLVHTWLIKAIYSQKCSVSVGLLERWVNFWRADLFCFVILHRWCMKDRSSTTPLACAITNNSCFGTSTAVAASTNWTRSPKRSRCSATRGLPSLRSECTMHTSSKVQLQNPYFSLMTSVVKLQFWLWMLLRDNVLMMTGSPRMTI